MMHQSVAEWLRWQESLSPDAIDLSLERTLAVADRLSIEPPTNGVFTIAGTNGKGSSANFLESLMISAGLSTAVYSSPHLVSYNERFRLNGDDVTDDCLLESFAAVEDARQDVPLTFFEFGTLTAMFAFSREQVDIWILEIGLGGRFDAVNIIDPDYSLITTIALDHQDWLGETVEEIAAEKAGIIRPTAPAFFGDTPIPEAIVNKARDANTRLSCLGRDFDYATSGGSWSWRGGARALSGLHYPAVADGAQLRNMSLVLAAVEAHNAAILTPEIVNAALQRPSLPGRFHIIEREHQWILDVAHNQQAARTLYDRVASLGPSDDTTAVISMLADKQVGDFVAELAGIVDRWIVCEVHDPRASSTAALAAEIYSVAAQTATQVADLDESFDLARRTTADGGRIIICGSFRIVGPALQWLGLY